MIRHHVFTTTSAIPIKFSTSVSWGWEWIWLWSVVVHFPPSRIHDYISYTYQILNLGIMRLRIDMAMISSCQWSAITYSQLHQLYLSNSQPRYHEVKNWYGYDQWLSIVRHHVFTTTSAIPIQFWPSVSWGWELIWQWSVVINFPPSRIHNYISYTYQLLNLGLMRLRIDMAMINGYQFSAITYSQLHQLYLSNSDPRYHEVENWYGYDQWWSIFCHHVFTTTSAIPNKFSTTVSWGWELVWLWTVVINFPPSRIHSYISYTYQILNLGVMRLRNDMATISGYQFSAITCSQLHQLYLSTSQPRYHEVENWYGYDQWLSIFRHHVFKTTSVIPIKFSTSESWGWDLIWLWSVVIHFPPSRIHDYISYTYQILNLGIMRLRIDMAMISSCQWSAITYSQLHQLYLSNSQPRYHEVENWYGYDQWWSIFRHHVFTTTSAIPNKFSTSVSWGWELIWLWSVVINFPPSRIHNYISYTYQILNLGILRLRIDMAMISGDQFSAITYSQLHQLYLSNSQPWYHEVENWYGYDQWLSIFRHHVFTTTSALPIKFWPSVSWGWELIWLWSVVINFPPSRIHNYISYTYQILTLRIMRLRIDMATISCYQFSAITYSQLHQLYLSNSQPRYPEVENWYGYDQWLSIVRHHVFTTTSAIPINFSTLVSWGWELIWLWSVVINFPPSRIHNYISYTYQIPNLGIMRLRIDMAMISGYQFSAITYSQLHQLYLSNSQPWCHEVENWYGYDQWLSISAITYSQLHQLYLSNSQPRYPEVENWYGYDQWLSIFRHHVFTTTSAIPINFSTLVSWGWEFDMAMISGYQFSAITAITCSQLHQLYLSNSDPRYHEVENWYGYDQWLSIFRHHVFTTTSAIPIKFSTSVSWGWELIWLWSVVINFPPSRIHNYISYTYQILNLGIMRLRIDMYMNSGYQFSAITYSQLHQLYLSNSQPQYPEVKNWYGYDQWLSIFRHHVFTTTSARPIKFWPSVSWGCELIWLWSVVINFPPSRIHNYYITYTYQILGMAMINGYQFSAITYSKLHQLHLSNSQPRYPEVANWYGYDQWLSIFRHHVFKTTSVKPLKFSTSVSWGWELIWLWSVVINFPPSRIHNYYISYTYQILNLGIIRLRIDMAMISSCQWSAIKYSQLHQLDLSNSQPGYHEVENCYGYDQWLSFWSHVVFTTTSVIPIKFSTSVSWGWELICIWSVVINFPPSRIHNYISYTYQILNLGIMRLRIDMAMVSGYQWSAITYSQLHQLYLSNSQPWCHEVENWYGYDQWLSIFRLHVFTTTSALPIKFPTSVSWGWELIWLWSVVINFPPSRIHNYISYTYQILNLGIMRLRIDMAMITCYQWSAITYSQLYQLYLSNSQPWHHEVENWYGNDQWLSIFCHHVFTTTSAIPIKFSTSVSWGWELIWLWSVVINFPPSRIPNCISYTYQILNLGIMRLRIDMAMMSGYQFSAITYSQLHQLYLSNSQPWCPEVENWYGYDQGLSIFRHHVFTATSAIPIKFSTSVSWGWELIWLWSVVVNDPPSRIHIYISYTYKILNLGIMRLRIAMAMINGWHFEVMLYSQLVHQLYLSNSDPRYHEVENWYGYDQLLSIFRHHVFTTTSAIPIKFSTSVSWGWELIRLWSVVINFPPSRIHNYISYTYQILNLGDMRLRLDMAMISGYQFFRHHVFTATSAIPIKFSTSVSWGWELVWLWSVVVNDPPSRIHNYISYTYQLLNLGIMRLRIGMAMINGYQFSAITYSQLHQLYLSNSDPRYHEVENWYGYDQWLSIFCHHVFTTTSALPIKFWPSVSWGWEMIWLWSVVINDPPSRIPNCISYTYQILNLGIMRLRIDMAMISGYQFSAITYSRLHQLYLSNSQPRYHEVENWYGYDQWLSIFRHHVFTTTSVIPIKFSTSVSWGWKLIWLWSVVINFPPSRIHSYISYTYQILNLGIMRLRIDMAMISSCQWSAITYLQLHQLYLSGSQPRYHEVENCYGYDQWLAFWSHVVFTTTTSALPIKFSTSVSWGWELIWLWSVVINFPLSRIHNYISYTYQILNLGDMRLRLDMAMISGDQFSVITYSRLYQLYLSNSQLRFHEVENWYGYDQWFSIFRHHVFTTTSVIPIKFSTSVSWGWELIWLWSVVINFPPSRIHNYISYTYQILNLGIMRLRTDMAMISGYQWSAITSSQLHQL